jgi:hypothetical protein
MEYRDDLRTMCWHDLYVRFIAADAANGAYVRQVHALQAELKATEAKNANQLRVIAGLADELRAAKDKPAPVDPPVFEVGKYYRNKRGVVIGPLMTGPNELRPLAAHNRDYTTEGKYYDGRPSDKDLLPGAVDPPPAWTPPASLPDGDYQWNGTSLGMIGRTGCFHSTSEGLPDEWRPYRDLTAPKVGRWRVTSGKAEWLGDA